MSEDFIIKFAFSSKFSLFYIAILFIFAIEPSSIYIEDNLCHFSIDHRFCHASP